MADEEEQDVGPKTRTGAEQAAALDRVTDREDDKEMRAADTSKIQQAMAALAAQQRASQEAQRQRDRELAAVKVAQEDIELLAAEFELDKKAAERKLRENKGDAKATIEALLREFYLTDRRYGRAISMANYETLAASLEDRWFGTGPSTLRHSIASSSDLQNSNPEYVAETLHPSPSAPNLRQRSTLKTGHLRRKPAADQIHATEKPPRGHIRRASTSSIDLSNYGGTGNFPVTAQAPANGTTTGAIQQLGPPPQVLGRPPRPDAPSRSSARSFLKPQNTKDYAERRKAWRARLEATMAAPRLYTATVPVPAARTAAAAGSRASSVHTTPSGSPKPPPSPLRADESATAAANAGASVSNSGGGGDHPTHPAVPAVWVGHSSDQAPQDFSALDDDALRRFLQQAGSSSGPITAPPVAAVMNHEELVAAARSSKGAWEVERIVVGCSLPEQVLRVQKSDCIDPVILKAAWKKLAFQVHPDRCSAEGASVAMAIAKDAFDILAWRAEQYQAEAAYAAARLQNEPISKMNASALAGQGIAVTTSAEIYYSSEQIKLDVDGKDTKTGKSLRPLSAPTETSAAPLKVRVKLKVKKVEAAKPLSSTSLKPRKEMK